MLDIIERNFTFGSAWRGIGVAGCSNGGKSVSTAADAINGNLW
ncbi:hypothetical protein [Azospirillum palustre]